MTRVWRRFLVLALLLGVTAEAQEKVAVLVPGFFNIPGQNTNVGLTYFSKTIVKAVRSQGYTPIVINDLNPVGTIRENGQRLSEELHALALKYPSANFTILAHSAGGLYAGYALTLQPNLPVVSVVTISTPYAGVELLALLKWIPGVQTIVETLNLDGLEELQTEQVAQTLAHIRIPSHVRWIALGASQPTCSFLNCGDARYQTWLLSLAWRYAGKSGDGVVTVDSATAQGVSIQTLEGPAMKIETWPQFIVPLEHWETVLDGDLLIQK